MSTARFSVKHAILGATLGILCLVIAFPVDSMVRFKSPQDVAAFVATFNATRIPQALPLITSLLGGLISGIMLAYAIANQRGVAAVCSVFIMLVAVMNLVFYLLLR